MSARSAVVPLLLFTACALSQPASAEPDSLAYGGNAVVNPGAEDSLGGDGFLVVHAPGWTSVSTPTVVRYNVGGGFPTPTDPGPLNRGANFFAGGPNTAYSEIQQTIDLTPLAASIDSGTVRYALGAYLGGFDGQTDYATVLVQFLGESMQGLDSASIGPVTVTDRGSATGLLARSASGTMQPRVRTARVRLRMTRFSGTYCDGYADSIALVFTKAPPTAVGDLRDPQLTASVAPTPSRASVVIRYGLERAARVRVDVVDGAGRLVRRLLDENVPAGGRSIRWDGRDARGGRVPPGVYAVIVAAGARSTTVRAVVLDPR